MSGLINSSALLWKYGFVGVLTIICNLACSSGNTSEDAGLDRCGAYFNLHPECPTEGYKAMDFAALTSETVKRFGERYNDVSMDGTQIAAVGLWVSAAAAEGCSRYGLAKGVIYHVIDTRTDTAKYMGHGPWPPDQEMFSTCGGRPVPDPLRVNLEVDGIPKTYELTGLWIAHFSSVDEAKIKGALKVNGYLKIDLPLE